MTSHVPASTATTRHGLFRPSDRGTGLEKSALCGLGNGGGARGDVELVQSVGDVTVDGVLTESEHGRGLFVAQPLRHESENLELTLSQASGFGRVSGVLGCGGFQMTQEPCRPNTLPRRPDLLQDDESCSSFPSGGVNTPQGG